MRSKRNPKKYQDGLLHGLAIGAVAAAAIVSIDSLVSRVPVVNATATRRAVGRLGVAALGAGLAMKYDAPNYVPEGIVAGVVSYTMIDAALGAIGTTRPAAALHPPTVANAGELGNPWTPRGLI